MPVQETTYIVTAIGIVTGLGAVGLSTGLIYRNRPADCFSEGTDYMV